MPTETQTSPEDIKQQISSLFNIVADGYDNPSTRFFQFCADKMLDILQPEQGTRLLDIATGTGAVATNAAQRVSPGGEVHGIDLSEKMLEVAFNNAQKMALNNIELQTMDAENPTFESDYFHNITCSFGIFFLPDMHKALENWLKVLQPNGNLIISTFAADAFSPLTDNFRSRLKTYGIEIPDTHWFRLSQAEECQQLLASAGFSNINVIEKQMGYHLINTEDWWDILWNTGYRGFLNQLSATDLASFRVAHLKELEEFKTDDGLWLNINTLFTTAKKQG